MNNELKSVKAALDHWRDDDRSRGPVPASLQKRAVGLLESYTWAEVVRELGISNSSISKWRKRHSGEGTVKAVVATGGKGASRVCRTQAVHRRAVAERASFVAVPPEATGNRVSPAEDDWTLELETSSGARLRLRGTVEPAALRALAEVVLAPEGRRPCSK